MREVFVCNLKRGKNMLLTSVLFVLGWEIGSLALMGAGSWLLARAFNLSGRGERIAPAIFFGFLGFACVLAGFSGLFAPLGF